MFRILAFFAAFLLFTQSLLAQEQLSFFLLNAPEILVPGAKRISILDFQGDKGRQLSDNIISKLMQPDLGIHDVTRGLFDSKQKGMTLQKDATSAYYSIVERSELDRVLAEKKFSASAGLDDAQLSGVGSILGVDLLISGTLKLNRGQTYSVSNGMTYYTNKVRSVVTFKVIDVKTGKLIASKVHESTKESADSRTSPALSYDLLEDKAMEANAYEIATLLTPHFGIYKFGFEKIKVKEYKEDSKKALDLVEKGDLTPAYGIYKKILDIDPYNAHAAMNIAFIYMAAGNFAKGAEYAKMSEQIDPSLCKSCGSFVQSTLNQEAALRNLGVTLPIVDFDLTTVQNTAKAKTVLTRGRKSDRHEVKESVDPGSKTIASIPGDTEFEVIEMLENVVSIKLLGGKTGYISKALLKL